VQRLDGDKFDVAINTWIQNLCAAHAPRGRRRAVAVDGKTVRLRREVARGE